MNDLRPLLIVVFTFLLPFIGFSQVEMADDFRGEGKIYVVIAIILTLLIGFFYLLFRLDKKTKKLEEEITERREEK